MLALDPDFVWECFVSSAGPAGLDIMVDGLAWRRLFDLMVW